MPDDLAPETGGDRDWHWRDAAPDEQTVAPAARRGQLLALLTLLVAALVAAVIGFLSWPRGSAQPTVVASMIVWERDHPLFPAQVVAIDDSEAILQHFPDQRRHTKASQARDSFRAEFAKLASQEQGPVVVHLSCLARTYGGAVYLLPSDARPEAEDHWLRLDEVLKLLGDCPAKDKLLLLDIAYPLADTRLGLVVDDVAQGVKKTLDGQNPRFAVLISCGPGQTAQVSGVLGQSVFAHFVDQGLRGDADGWADGFPNKVIKVKELAAYVSHHTERWSKGNHGVKQTPWFWERGDDFTLVDLDARAPPEQKKADDANKGENEKKDDEEKPDKKKEQKPKTSYPPQLDKAWKLREELAVYEGRWLPAAVLTQIDTQLLDIEHNWRGDRRRDERVAQLGEKDLSQLTAQMEQLRARLAATVAKQGADQPPSIAAAMMSRPETDKALVKTIADSLKKVTVNDVAKELSAKEKEEQDKADAKLKADAELEFTQIVKDIKDPEEKAAALLDAAVELGNLNRLQTALLLEAIAKLLPRVETIETIWLNRAREWDKYILARDNPVVWQWPAADVGQALRTLRASEALIALLAQEPGLLQWLEPDRYGRAEADRRQGEDLLFWGRPKQRKEAVEKLSQAAKDYETLHRVLSDVRQARRAHHQARVQLPGWFLWLTARAELDVRANLKAGTDPAWHEAYDLTQQLGERLAEGGPKTAKDTKGDALSTALKTLASRHQDAFDECTKVDKDHLPEAILGALHVIRTLRAGAGLTAKQRDQLWNNQAALAAALHAKFEPVAKPPAAVALSATLRDETEWKIQTNAARVRVELALDLLTIAKVAEVAQGRADLKGFVAEAPPQDFEKLGWSVRTAWQKLRTPEAAADKAAAGFKFLLPVIGGDGPLQAPDVDGDAKWASAFRRWLSDHYQGEAKFLEAHDRNEDVPGRSGFFSKLAERFRR